MLLVHGRNLVQPGAPSVDGVHRCHAAAGFRAQERVAQPEEHTNSAAVKAQHTAQMFTLFYRVGGSLASFDMLRVSQGRKIELCAQLLVVFPLDSAEIHTNPQ